ncbi:MAG: hypothetical protein FJW61_06790 [Actinobacteria bacterium]|nr:hypothetical protein [Actinomycetota bacterium]
MYLVLIDNRKIVLLSSFFVSFSILLFFLRESGKWAGRAAIIGYIVSAVILFIGFNSTNRNLTTERKNSIEFHPARVIMRGIPTLMFIFSILFSVIFYFNFPLMDKDKNIEVREEHLKKISEPFGDIINKYLPIYDLDMTADEFIILNLFLKLPFVQGEDEIKLPVDVEKIPEKVAEYLKDRGVYGLEEIDYMQYMREDKEFRNIFIEEIKKLTDKADPHLLDRYRLNLSENWGIELSGEEKMASVYTRLLNNRINQFPERTKSLFLILPVISLFGILQVVFTILGIIYSLFAWVAMIIFYKARFYRYRKIEVEKEELEL